MPGSIAENRAAVPSARRLGPGLRRAGEPLSTVTITCHGGVNSDLPYRALRILSQHGIAAEHYILSPHSVSVFLKPAAREAGVRALHSLI